MELFSVLLIQCAKKLHKVASLPHISLRYPRIKGKAKMLALISFCDPLLHAKRLDWRQALRRVNSTWYYFKYGAVRKATKWSGEECLLLDHEGKVKCYFLHASVFFFNSILDSHCLQDDITNLCGNSWFELWDERVEPIWTSLSIPRFHPRISSLLRAQSWTTNVFHGLVQQAWTSPPARQE